jgi:hypothetical protein
LKFFEVWKLGFFSESIDRIKKIPKKRKENQPLRPKLAHNRGSGRPMAHGFRQAERPLCGLED